MDSSIASYFGMVVVQIAYGGSNILMKLALEKGLNQFVFVVYRHIIAMLLLSPFAYILERKTRPSLSFYAAMKIFLLASLGTTVHLNVYYTGLKYTTPTVASALSNVIPCLTTLIAVVLGMETLKVGSNRGKAKLFGMVVCVGGSLIFTFWKGECVFTGFEQKPLIQIYDTDGKSRNHKENWVKGSLLILISYVAWSAWLILQATVYKIYPARLSLNVLICFFASLQSSILAMFLARNPHIWKLDWNIQLLAILYCGVVISALVYWLQTWCISKKGPVFAAMFSPLLLVIVGIFSAIAFAERLHLGSLLGTLLIVFGLYWVLWGKKTETKEPCSSRRGGDDDKILDIPADNSTMMAPTQKERQNEQNRHTNLSTPINIQRQVQTVSNSGILLHKT